MTAILTNSSEPKNTVCIRITATIQNLRTGNLILSDDRSELHSNQFAHLFDEIQILGDYEEGITIDQFKQHYL